MHRLFLIFPCGLCFFPTLSDSLGTGLRDVDTFRYLADFQALAQKLLYSFSYFWRRVSFLRNWFVLPLKLLCEFFDL